VPAWIRSSPLGAARIHKRGHRPGDCCRRRHTPPCERQGCRLRIELDAEKYLSPRSELLHAEFLRVDRLAQAKELPDASITDGVLKITPLDNQESDEAELLTRQAYGLMPRIKITDLLTEVDFGRHFTNLRSRDAVSDRALLLTAILADGINLGLTRMADACPGVSLSTLSRIATWHIRDETYAKALAEIVNHHHRAAIQSRGGAEKQWGQSMPATATSRARRSILTSGAARWIRSWIAANGS